MSKDNNVFDLRKFQSKARPPEEAKPKRAAPKRSRTDETFARIPYHRVTQAYGKLSAAALHVVIELDHQHFQTHENPVRLSNQTALAAMGMHRSTKGKALRELRDVGLISFTQVGQGAFMVTLSWYP